MSAKSLPGAVGTSQVPVPGAANGTPFFVDTGNIPTTISNRFGTEFLWVHGPLSIQSEAMCAWSIDWERSNVFFPGVYAQVGYFLTGEHRPYDRTLGCIDRVKPFEDFFRVLDRQRHLHGPRGLGSGHARCRGSI